MKCRVRIVTAAWGDAYLDELLSVTLHAVAAPGNLPALAAAHDCELVLVTESRFFEHIRAAEIWHRISAICPARLVSLDDLVYRRLHYGLTLTFAYLRGFADLGPAMTGWHMVFFNSDFVIADGSWRTLAGRIAAGERLVLSPSYCVVRETVEPLLRQELAGSGLLSVPPRRMARLALDHLHHTIRGKTVNQRVYAMDRMEQFFWHVDDDTLLARQLPIAVVALRPERARETLETFWDYGLMAELCPTASPCVLGDSDDFLMIELRDDARYSGMLSLGWPTAERIAKDLSGFTTKDQRDCGRHTLVLHAAELPPGIAAAKAKLAAFVDDVYARMSPAPLSHLGHAYWKPAVEAYERAQAAWRAREVGPAPASAPNPPRRGNPVFRAIFGKWPKVTKAHPSWVDLDPAVREIESALAGGKAKALVVGFDETGAVLSPLVQRLAGHTVMTGAVAVEHGQLDREPGRGRDFALCLMELPIGALARFPRLVRAVRPYLAPGARLVAHFDNRERRPLGRKDARNLKDMFPRAGTAHATFAGSPLHAQMRRALAYAERLAERFGTLERILPVLALFALAPLALVANAWAASRRPEAFPRACTSLTVVYDLD